MYLNESYINIILHINCLREWCVLRKWQEGWSCDHVVMGSEPQQMYVQLYVGFE